VWIRKRRGDVKDLSRPRKRRPLRARTQLFAITGAVLLSIVVAVPAQAHLSSAQHIGQQQGASPGSQGTGANDGTQMANLKVVSSKESCEQLATTTEAGGQAVDISAYQVGADPDSGVEYCAITGTINTNIGFEVLLPVSTWRQRYLQVGCGGLCGSIGLSAPQTSDYAPLQDGDFVIASQDEGHSGQSTAWSTNGAQRVDFAYSSDHQLALVSKGLATMFYGLAPKYSYFDGCSQGGHQALTEVQRYPNDFNGVLAGSPANIMTELNSVFHEYENDAALDATRTSEILDEPMATLVNKAALAACDPSTDGLMLDYRSCEEKFNLETLLCPRGFTQNVNSPTCLTQTQINAFKEIYNGPVDPQGNHLFPGGYPLGSEPDMTNGTSVLLPATLPAAAGNAGFITEWYQYFGIGTPATGVNLGNNAVLDEQFTDASFDQIEQLAPFWDATNPNIGRFARDGGKLLLWAGEADYSIPTVSSLSYYQAVVKANGGLQNTQRFARYYLLPSVGHCGDTTSDKGADEFNGLGAVVQWTELGQAPNSLVATQHTDETVAPAGGSGGPPPGGGAPPTSDLTDAIPAFGVADTSGVHRTLPIFPYPDLPAYNGRGNPDSASSYHGQVSEALQQPTPWLGKFDSATTWCTAQGTSCYTTSDNSPPPWLQQVSYNNRQHTSRTHRV
jgi:Tannase and feruloyl esterase